MAKKRVRRGREEAMRITTTSEGWNKEKARQKKSNNMDYDGGFIMQKTVDWSLPSDGMTIPVSACALLKPPTTTASSTRTIPALTATSSSSNLRMVRC